MSTRSVLDGPSAGLRANVVFSVADSWTHPLSLLASVFWPTGLRGYLLSSVALLGVGIVVERRLGRAWYAAALVVTQVGALLTVAAAAAAVSMLWAGAGAYVTGLHYGGPWCAVVGAAFAATGGLTALWRRRIRVGGLALLTTGLLYSGGAVAVMTVTAALIGWALGRRWHRRGRPRGTAVAAGGAVGSLQEARTLGALIVAATAAGPMLAALNPAANGPLAVTAYLMAPMRGARADVVAQLCTEAPSSPACTLGGGFICTRG